MTLSVHLHCLELLLAPGHGERPMLKAELAVLVKPGKQIFQKTLRDECIRKPLLKSFQVHNTVKTVCAIVKLQLL